MQKTSQYALWLIVFMIAGVVLILGLTGRMALLASIAIYPDNVVVTS